jgi:hypothetical protein
MKKFYLPPKIPNEIPKWMYLVRGFMEVFQGLYDIGMFPFGKQGGWLLMHWQGKMLRSAKRNK